MRIKSMYVVAILFLAACENDTASESVSGQAGSMTRFAVMGDFIYVATQTSLQVFHIDGTTFTAGQVQRVTEQLETVFATPAHLYLGSRDAMYIYSLDNPGSPSLLFRYQHISSCDPVVVQGNRAYVTLSSGSTCNAGLNALEIIDITDKMNPALIANYPLASPKGLAVDGNLLFICEAFNGLKVFDIRREQGIESIFTSTQHPAYDVIAADGLATVTGEDGIFQYAYDDDGVTLIGTIPVSRQ